MQSAYYMSEREKRGKIFSQDDKDRMQKAFRIPDLAAIRGNPLQRETEMRWKGAQQFIKTLNKGYTLQEASEILDINVSPIQFAISLLESRGQRGNLEDPYLIAALFGIEVGSQAGGQASAEGVLNGNGADAELLAQYSRHNETLDEFRKRIQNSLHAHIESVTALHDEIFSYKHHDLVVTSRGGLPGRRIRGTNMRADHHCATWSSYQDELVQEQTEYYQAKPWARQPDRHLDEVQQLADQLEQNRKARDLARHAARDLENGIDIGGQGSSLTQLRTIYPAVNSIRGKSPRSMMATVLHATQRDLTNTVVHLQGGVWTVEHNTTASANRHRSQRPLSALYTTLRHRNFGMEAYERYAKEMMPRFTLPMSHQTTGKHPAAGLMRHTGALCPSFDQPWNTDHMDLADADHEALMRSSIMVARSDVDRPSQASLDTTKSKDTIAEASPAPSTPEATRRRNRPSKFGRKGPEHEHSILSSGDSKIAQDIRQSYNAYALAKSQRTRERWLDEDTEKARMLASAPHSHVPDVERGEAGGKSLRGELVGSDSELGSWIASAAEKLAVRLQTGEEELRGPGGLMPAGFARVTSSTAHIGMSSPVFSPIILCCPISELDEAISKTPTKRLCDLVVMHTGLHRSLIASRLEKRRFEHHRVVFQVPETHPQARHKQQVLKWMASRSIIGAVEDEVLRLEQQHQSMVGVNNTLRRFLDAVPLAASDLRSQDQPSEVGVENIRRILQHDSEDFKKKVELHRQMVDEIESQICAVRKMLHIDPDREAMPSAAHHRTREQSSEATMVVLNVDVGAIADGMLTFDTSYVHGRFARAVRDLLHVMHADCVEVATSDELDARAWVKLLWQGSTWLISASNGNCNMRDVTTKHRDSLRVLVTELVNIASRAHALTCGVNAPGCHLLSSDAVMADIDNRTRQYQVGDFVPRFEQGRREAQWTNGIFLSKGTPAEQPTHVKLLEGLNMDTSLLLLQGQRQKLQESRLQHCLANLSTPSASHRGSGRMPFRPRTALR